MLSFPWIGLLVHSTDLTGKCASAVHRVKSAKGTDTLFLDGLRTSGKAVPQRFVRC